MRLNRAISFPLAVAVAALSVAPLTAQDSTTDGFMIGGHLLGSGITIEDGDRHTGGGGGLRLGYGVHPNITLFLQLDGSAVDVEDEDGESLDGDWTMGHVHLGARFNLANTESRWIPYLATASTGRAFGVSDVEIDGEDVGDLDMWGGAYTLGGGLMFYFNESLALDVGLLFSAGEFTEIDTGVVSVGSLDIDANSSRLTIGVTGWP